MDYGVYTRSLDPILLHIYFTVRILMRTLSPARRPFFFEHRYFSVLQHVSVCRRGAVSYAPGSSPITACDFVRMLFLFIIISILILLFIYLCLSAGAAMLPVLTVDHSNIHFSSRIRRSREHTHYARMAFRNAFNAGDKTSDRKWRTCRQLTL